MKRWLLAQDDVEAAAMTGSGSALFAIPTSADASENLIAKAKNHYGETLWAHATHVRLP